ncbi:MAG: hypothetical protein OEM07_05675, partial [Gammaproteobacteria bacterium]|nr:hypothetical protein [Gammaproteobacteria bacterium]
DTESFFNILSVSPAYTRSFVTNKYVDNYDDEGDFEKISYLNWEFNTLIQPKSTVTIVVKILCSNAVRDALFIKPIFKIKIKEQSSYKSILIDLVNKDSRSTGNCKTVTAPLLEYDK